MAEEGNEGTWIFAEVFRVELLSSATQVSLLLFEWIPNRSVFAEKQESHKCPSMEGIVFFGDLLRNLLSCQLRSRFRKLLQERMMKETPRRVELDRGDQ